MNSYYRYIGLTLCSIILVFLLSCTENEKHAKVVITEQEYTIRQDSDINWVIDAKGKIKNVGDVDVKKVIITGFCRSCTKVLNAGIWTISDYEKSFDREQLDRIKYLAMGHEEAFSFKEVAFYFDQSGQPPTALPDELEIIVESFETVE